MITDNTVNAWQRKPLTPSRPISASDKERIEELKAMGITLDANGNPTGDPFQGTPTPGASPDDLGLEEDDDPPEPFARLQEDDPEPLPGDDPAAQIQDPEPEPATPRGLEKREQDARKAQSEMSKTEARLKILEANLNQKADSIDAQLQQLAALQATVGTLPADLDPADASTLAQWREDQPELIQVMHALIAPYHQAIGQMREQVTGLTRQLGEFLSKTKSNEVLGQLYGKVPKEKLEALQGEPKFIDWLSRKPERKRAIYLDYMVNTSRYTPDDVLDMLDEFSLATGYDLGMKTAPAKPERPAPPSAPRLRSGSALPEPEAPRRPDPNAELTPLSPDEMANISDLLGKATPQQSDLYQKRLALSFSAPT